MTVPIEFYKMHGLGNDFAIIDNIRQSIDIKQLQVKQLADRHFGIGFDQLLLLEKSDKANFSCLIFNADGSTAEQCGNGMRCMARFVHENKLILNNVMTFETKAGILEVLIHDYEHIQIMMGLPNFEPQEIPFLIEHSANMFEVIDINPNELTALSMGNPHAIIQVPSIKNYPVKEVGSQIDSHPAFPAGANTGFVEVVDRNHIRLRTFERGSGETFACGSNACAAVVAGIKNGWLDNIVDVELTYGSLLIEWQGDNSPVKMTGPAAMVFKGILN